MRNKIWIAAVAALAALGIVLYLLFGSDEGAGGGGEENGESLSHGVVINEVMASNGSYVPDEDGDFPDWIELYNPTDKAVNLSSWALSDSADQAKWVFPSGVSIGPGEYLLVYCSDKDRSDPDQPLHTNFKINAGKEHAVLIDGGGRVVESVAAVTVGEGKTIARQADDSFAEMDPSPGYENSAAGVAAYQASRVNGDSPLIINEFQPNNQSTLPGEDGSYPEWIEIHNPSGDAIDLSGSGLSDDPGQPLKWRFPQGSRIEAGAYLLVYTDSAARDNAGEGTPRATFNLDNYAESVALSDAGGRSIDSVDYEDIPADASYGRDSGGEWRVYVQPTPGYPNTEAGYQQFESAVGQSAYGGGVYISEVMLTNRDYAEDEGAYYDWIELHNPTGAAVNLAGWGLSDDSGHPRKWRFPDGTTLGAGEYLLVYASGLDLPKKKFGTDSSGMILLESQDSGAGAAQLGIPSEGEGEASGEGGADGEEGAAEDYDGALHASFRLSNVNGEIVTLWNPEKQVADRLACPPQLYQSSSGRDSGGGIYRLYRNPSPGEANGGDSYSGRMESPTIDLPGGLYSGSQTVTVNYEGDGALRYTTDGSPPTAESPEWPGSLTVTETGPLRVSAFDPYGQRMESQPATATYIIDSPHDGRLSIVAVSVDPEDMYGYETGIYVKGPNASDTFPYKGANFWEEWEKTAHVEIFTPAEDGGELQISQEAAFRIFGAYSRGQDQKGFAMIPRSVYGEKGFNYPIFENRPYDSYQSLVLRAGAQDATITKIHDVVATALVDGATNLEVQAYRQAVLYINGEYFGYYHIREKINKHWIAQHYGYDPEKVDLLVGNGTALSGSREDYDALIDYCASHHLSNAEDYAYVASQIDIDNYIDYLICEMYVANTDTGNIKFFRENSDDPENSKWRWIYYDFCWSFISRKMDSFQFLTKEEGHGVGAMFSTQLSRSLFQNQDFRNQFLRRFAELLNSIYEPENVLAKIEEVEAVLATEKERDSERWPETSVGGWQANVNHMKLFAQERKDYCIGFLRLHFGLSGDDALRIFGSEGLMNEEW